MEAIGKDVEAKLRYLAKRIAQLFGIAKFGHGEGSIGIVVYHRLS
jgi:hypothetical protein